MGLIRRLRERGEAYVARKLEGEAVGFSAAIPGSTGPLCEFRFEAAADEQAGGERVRLRAHFSLRLRGAKAHTPGRGRLALPARIGCWIERRLASPVAQVLAAPVLDRDVNTWVEVRASSAALDEGSRALVPEKLKVLGVEPQPGKPLQTWAGGLRGPRPGYAVLTLMQLDKDQLPAPLQRALGPKPFQLAATVVNVIEDA